MLKELHIRNFAIIDKLFLNFGEGFNVITGETGAGKSIIVESLSFVFGSRLSFNDIKDEVYVKAIFKNEKDEYVLSRIYDKKNKSRYFLNNKQVPYSEIDRLKIKLIDFHSQMENIALFDKDYQISLIDSYIGIENEVKKYNKLFEERKELLSRLNALNLSEAERQKMIDVLRFQIDEIENAKLKDGEDIILEEKIYNYKNKTKIISSINFIENILNGENGVLDLIFKAKKKIYELNELGDFSDLSSKIDLIHDNMNDFKEVLKEKKGLYDFSEDIDQLIERDDLIKKLKRKYNVLTVSELICVLENLKKEFSSLSSADNDIDVIKEKLSEIEKEMDKIACYVSKQRKEGAKKLSRKILSVLKDLDLKNSRFEILVEPTDQYFSNGKDHIEFLFSSTEEFPLKPIKYVLSGGEISRVMVAIKYIFCGIDRPATMILDEIDTGTGGNTAFKIGKIIKEIAKTTQVICITHLPQIAVFADTHIKVEKRSDQKRSFVYAKVIDSENERIEEIGRMFGSEYSSHTAFRHAMELLKRCRSN